ncbi:MAG: polysaccharide export protein [Methylococcales bacterium]
MKRKIPMQPVLIFFSLAVILAGCAEHPPIKTKAELPSDYTYIIGPGDNVEMFVWGNPEISRSVPVRPDGKITAPLVEELPASGKTPYQLARDIEQELAKYIRNPLVTVIVTEFVGPYSEQIRIIGFWGGGSGFGGGGSNAGTSSGSGSSGGIGSSGGSIGRAMALSYRENMTLLDVVVEVGSYDDYADGNRASVVRHVNGVRKQFRIRLDDLISDGDMSANIELLPGDIIFVPEAFF